MPSRDYSEDLNEIISAIKPYAGPEGMDLVIGAFHFAREKHKGRRRASGEPYFIHCIETAKILIELSMDAPTIAASLLHDVMEDEGVTYQELEGRFGKEIADLVGGVTKISSIEFFGSSEERQVENYRKLTIAMARDIRVLLIKLADRLHNMRTLEYLPSEKRRKIALETLEIYAPLAHRLGIFRIKVDLEDLAFKHLHPEEYRQIAQLVSEKREERERRAREVAGKIKKVLDDAGIEAKVSGRTKHFYSIYRKMRRQNIPFENLYDLTAFRVLVKDVPDCYAALGVIHSKWTPIPGRIKDYIALPKSNRYQSLHTTVIESGRPVEIQIRTYDMHKIAEYGIAAHWKYKEGVPGQSPYDNYIAWLRSLVEQMRDVNKPAQFITSIKTELAPEEIYVFTPKGDLKVLPEGATPIDFAYSVHTEIGHHCVGAKVNNRFVSLRHKLQTGDIVEIITDPNAKPSKDWLRLVRSSRARSKIRRWLREHEREQYRELGESMIEAELKLRRLTPKNYLTPENLERMASELKCKSVEDMLVDIGYGKISAQHFVNLLAPEMREKAEEKVSRRRPTPTTGVIIDGIDQAYIRVAKCCNPIPGDEIVGYITRGRGLSIHVAGCPRIGGEMERVIPVSWAPKDGVTYPAEILVESDDRTGLLRDLSNAISKLEVNISQAHSEIVDPITSVHRFVVDVTGMDQLRKVMESLSLVKGVRQVKRKAINYSRKRRRTGRRP
jgi:GTP pyrophosphokinase